MLPNVYSVIKNSNYLIRIESNCSECGIHSLNSIKENIDLMKSDAKIIKKYYWSVCHHCKLNMVTTNESNPDDIKQFMY